MKHIEDIIKVEIALARENMIFQLLGQFGDRLPVDVQDEMRKEADSEKRIRNKFQKKLENGFKTNL